MLADFAMNKLTPVGAKQRTVQMTSWDAMREASKEAATKGIAEAAEIMKTGQVPDEGSALIDYSRDFTAGRDKLGENKLGRGVDRAVNFVFRTMKAEDRLTKRYAFTRSLKEQMALAKVKTPTPDMVTQAWLDADFMTFNQKNMAANEFSKLLGSLKRQGVVGETAAGVLDMLVPFKNTPANVFMRGFEASGFGVVSGGFKLARAIAAGERLTPVEQRNIAMTIGRGATGMAAVMAGYYLAKNGFMTGVTDKDEQGERNVRTLGGRQDGALKVGDKWISIAGLSPVANAFIVGATWYDSGKGAIWKILTSPETFGATSAAAFRDLPMVRGVSDAMEALQNPKRFAGQAAANMAGSFVPSIVNEAGQMTDTARRETRADSLPGQVARAVANRVPGLRQQLPERLDVFGRPIPQDQVGVAFGFPLSTETKDPVVKEMMRVDAKVGTAARGKAEKDEAYRKRLDRAGATTEQMERKPAETDAQYSERVKLQGKAMRNRLALLMVGNRYKQADDEMKADLIEETIKKARTRANKQARAGRR